MLRGARVLIGIAVVAVVVIGLTQASQKKAAGPKSRYDASAALASLNGAPKPLAALHRQHSQLLDGGVTAFKQRLAALRGYPVVINKWGSWCGPCRAEFPVFQRVAAAKGKTVAFLGIDGIDPRGEARKFLVQFPVTYPSYVDPAEKLARIVNAPANYPITVFVAPDGKVVIPHSGPYQTVGSLERDIKRYLHA
jgi:cytochrome c biogenesis protein CcmG/thiol:disulfide interchange protein DsbE